MEEDRAPRTFVPPVSTERTGLVVVYTGDGKGKTTAAMGVALRALGRGARVAVVQFIKGPWVSGERRAVERFGDLLEWHVAGEGFTWDTRDPARDRAAAKQGLQVCTDLLRRGAHRVYILDEILYALSYGFLDVEDVLALIAMKPVDSHLILTGRGAVSDVIDAADLVTEMGEIKHPYRKGIAAQPELDF